MYIHMDLVKLRGFYRTTESFPVTRGGMSTAEHDPAWKFYTTHVNTQVNVAKTACQLENSGNLLRFDIFI